MFPCVWLHFASIPMVNAVDVAKHLIWLAGQEGEMSYLTEMQVQKLLYYVQGWSLGLRGAPVFGEQFEAWPYGPVVREVNAALSGQAPLPVELGCEAKLSRDEAFLVRAVWEAYKKYSPLGLSDKTHAESPWRDARQGLEPHAGSDRVIDFEALRAFFTAQVGESEDFGLKAMPDWSRHPDDRFVLAAQAVMARRLPVLNRLAQ